MPTADPVLNHLRSLLDPKSILTAPEDMITYAFDASAPVSNQLPLAVLFPGTTQEVSAILRCADQYAVPVVPRGAATSLAGSSVPVPGSLVLSTARMRRILEIDSANLTALAEPGVTTGELAAAVEAQNLFYPPDPGSMAVSTLGGNVALNSGGLRGLKYGVTRDFVIGLEVVLASGEILYTGGKCKKDMAGYHLTSLFVGTEGTLGVFTQILVRLLPLPQATKTALAFFENIETAAQAVADVIAARIIPVTLELLDDVCIRCVEEYAQLGLPLDAGAMLLVEVDGPLVVVADEMAHVFRILERHQAQHVQVAEDKVQEARLKATRRATLAALARRKPTTILEDITVPRDKIPAMVRRIRQIAAHYQIEIAIFGHAGDGNLHPTGMTDARDVDELHRVEAAFDEIFDAALELGGTITGEHGVGLKKRHKLPAKVGAVGMQTMAAIKQALDPNHILNPGKVFQLGKDL